MKTESNPVFARFAANLISFPKATDDLDAGIFQQSKDVALLRRYVALNHRLAFYIVVDVDRAGAAFAWEDANLPPPTIATTNPINGHAHLAWELASPVATTPNSRSKPMEYLEATQHAIRNKVGGDIGYAGYLTKNPMHPSWHVITWNRRYDLGELAEYIDLDTAPRRLQNDALGRNATLFESLRLWAYRHVEKAESFAQWQLQCERMAHALNSFDDPLPNGEVRNTARSVSKWTWGHQGSLGKSSNGIMGYTPLSGDLDAETHLVEVCTRQSAGARYAHKVRRSKTAGSIETAVASLGMKLSTLRDKDAIRIAVHAGIGINTVRRFIARQQADYKANDSDARPNAPHQI